MFTKLQYLLSILIVPAALGLNVRQTYEGDEYHRFTSGGKSTAASAADPDAIHDISFADWNQIGQDTLLRRLNFQQNKKKAKNVIYFIGDGMGISTLHIARIHRSQTEKITVDKAKLAWDDWVNQGMTRTYNTDATVPDSAASGTALLCGEKCRQGVIGVTDKVMFDDDCSAMEGEKQTSVFHRAIQEGKLGGLVVTTMISSATPAAAYAHTPNRGYEADSFIPEERRDSCTDTTKQLITDELNTDIRVILGGGRSTFMTGVESDPEWVNFNGTRLDMNLIDEWRRLKTAKGVDPSRISYVTGQSEFDAINPDNTDYLLGLFEYANMNMEAVRDTDVFGEPSIAEMTGKAIEILERSSDENGYFLFVEGGRIDHAHHVNMAQRAITETLAMSDAVQKAMDLTDAEETLIVVSADHSHVFTHGAYSDINSDIYGVAIQGPQFADGMAIAYDELPYLSIAYTNGPGAYYHRNQTTGERLDPREAVTQGGFSGTDNINYMQDGGVPLDVESHAGEDVAMAASGPWSHLFTGTVEQNYLAHAIAYAACLDTGLQGDHCQGGTGSATTLSSYHSLLIFSLLAVLCCIFKYE